MPTTAPAPAGAEGMLVATGELYAYVNVSSSSSLTLRRAASTSSSAIGALRRGAKVQLLAFERPEQTFGSLEELKARIELDKAFAAGYFKKHPEIRLDKIGQNDRREIK